MSLRKVLSEPRSVLAVDPLGVPFPQHSVLFLVFRRVFLFAGHLRFSLLFRRHHSSLFSVFRERFLLLASGGSPLLRSLFGGRSPHFFLFLSLPSSDFFFTNGGSLRRSLLVDFFGFVSLGLFRFNLFSFVPDLSKLCPFPRPLDNGFHFLFPRLLDF